MNRVLTILLAALALAAAACSQDGTAATSTMASNEAPALPADVQHVADAMTPHPAGSGGHPLPAEERVSREFISPSRSDLASKMPGRVAVLPDIERTSQSRWRMTGRGESIFLAP